MEKFLFYSNATNDTTCMPAYRLVEMHMTSSTALSLNHRMYDSDVVGSDEEYTVSLTVTVNTGEKVMKTISNAINSGKNGFIVIADDLNKEYIDNDITEISTGLDDIG